VIAAVDGVEDETTEGGSGEKVSETVVVGEYWKVEENIGVKCTLPMHL